MSLSVFTLPYHYHILPLCLEPDLLSSVIYTHCSSVELVNPTMPSLDLIPFGILLWGNATMVYLCVCRFFVNVKITIGHFWHRFLELTNLAMMLRNANKHFWRRCRGYKPSNDASKCQHEPRHPSVIPLTRPTTFSSRRLTLPSR
jgi:hypothetical protein